VVCYPNWEGTVVDFQDAADFTTRLGTVWTKEYIGMTDTRSTEEVKPRVRWTRRRRILDNPVPPEPKKPYRTEDLVPNDMTPEQYREQEREYDELLESLGIPVNIPGPSTQSVVRRSSTFEHPLFGMVEIRLAELMVSKGIVTKRGPKVTVGQANAGWLAKKAGLTMDTAWALVKHPDKVRGLHLETVAKICTVLNCTPADWIIYVRPNPGTRALLSERYQNSGMVE
jgi:DNA-binding Xre family transcriptional regulator